jgi:phosphatidylglycerol:prolipoprotein diacylglycerol transferase
MVLTLAFDPVIVWLGPVPLGWHGIFASLGILLGAWLVSRLLRTGPWAEGVPDSVVGWAVAGALIGARLFHVIDHADHYAARPLEVLAIWQGGIAVYGGFAGALAGAVLAARRASLPIWPFLDAAAPGLLLGQAIGRIGCLLNGDAWGAPTGGSWGVIYLHPGAYLPDALLGVPTHPYPLYEAALDLVVLAALLTAGRRPARAGTRFLPGAAGYACLTRGTRSPPSRSHSTHAPRPSAPVIARAHGFHDKTTSRVADGAGGAWNPTHRPTTQSGRRRGNRLEYRPLDQGLMPVSMRSSAIVARLGHTVQAPGRRSSGTHRSGPGRCSSGVRRSCEGPVVARLGVRRP